MAYPQLGAQVPGTSIGAPTYTPPAAGPSAPSDPSKVGLKAASPAANVPPPSNTLTASQTAQPKDLSGEFANVNGTIYNKNTGTAYSTPQEFFSASGVNSFSNLKFDTAWQPPKTTSAGLQMPGSSSTLAPTPTTPNQSVNGVLPQLAAQTVAAPSTTQPAPTTTSQNSNNYVPPNQGTTGVSQGGLIGNLNANALNNPLYATALTNLNNVAAQQTALQTQGAQDQADINSRPEGLTEQQGQQGILAQLIASRQAALAPQFAAAQAALAGANTAQANTTSGLSAAASANAPITGVPIGTQNVSPSQPISGLNTGQSGTATTSGAANLNSLIGQRPSPSNPSVTEFYNTQTGQGFATPQALADFVNQQQPGANATAQNVFSLLQQQQQGGSSGLNPLANINQTAQQVVNGTLSYADALAAGSSVPTFTNALQQAITAISPGFNFNTAQGSSQAQQATTAQQQQLQATYTSAKQQAANLSSQFSNLIQTYGLNPQDLNVANGVLQTIAQNTSDWRYSALNNYVTDIANTYASILGAGGDTTDYVRTTAQGMLNNLASGQSMQAVIATLDQQAQAKIAGTQTAPITNNSANTASSGSSVWDF